MAQDSEDAVLLRRMERRLESIVVARRVAEFDLALAFEKFNQADAELKGLRDVVKGLRAIVRPAAIPDHAGEVDAVDLRKVEAQARQALDTEQFRAARAAVDAGRAIRRDAGVEPKTPTARSAQTGAFGTTRSRVAPSPTREVQEDGSTARVRQLLRRRLPSSVTPEQLLEDFRSRGWVEESWSDPQATVTQAARRAVTYGWARRHADGRFQGLVEKPDHYVEPPTKTE